MVTQLRPKKRTKVRARATSSEAVGRTRPLRAPHCSQRLRRAASGCLSSLAPTTAREILWAYCIFRGKVKPSLHLLSFFFPAQFLLRGPACTLFGRLSDADLPAQYLKEAGSSSGVRCTVSKKCSGYEKKQPSSNNNNNNTAPLPPSTADRRSNECAVQLFSWGRLLPTRRAVIVTPTHLYSPP